MSVVFPAHTHLLFYRLKCLNQQHRIAATKIDSSLLVESYKKVSEDGQEIPQSHTADQPTAPRERATEHL